MRIGLDTYCYNIPLIAGRYDVFRLIDLMPSLGVEGLQININGRNGRFLGADPRDARHVARVRNALRRSRLFVEVGGRSTCPDTLAWQLYLCRDLGADILRTVVSLQETMERTAEEARRGLEAVLPIAHEIGVRIALENHEDLTAAELVSIIEDIDDDHVGACVDTGNGLCVYEDPVETAARLAPYAISSHIKDQRLVRVDGIVYSVGVALGQGMVDLSRIVDILLERSPLDRLLVQDTTGYGVRLNPFGRDLGRSNQFSDIPDMSDQDLQKENLILSLEGFGKEDLLSLADAQSGNIAKDVSYLRTILAERASSGP